MHQDSQACLPTLDKRGKAAPATVEKAFKAGQTRAWKNNAVAVTCSRGELEEDAHLPDTQS